MDPEYRSWILRLQSEGFEIAIHNVGDGEFSREEILAGLEFFNNVLGHYPRCHSNHVSNPDNLYWLRDRFEWPLSQVYNAVYLLRHGHAAISKGCDPKSPHFWGDAAKKHIRYIRNYTFNGINTLRFDPKMPYRVRRKEAFSNLWFSSSDGHTVAELNQLLQPEQVDSLERDGGGCIIYTHFASGFVDAKGKLDPVFKRQMEYLSSKEGWFVPVSPLLDHLVETGSSDDPGNLYRMRQELVWLKDRISKKFQHGR
jgi:hypothetical protein